MNRYDKLKRRINDLLMYDDNEIMIDLHQSFISVLFNASSSKRTREELENFVFSDNDVLDNEDILQVIEKDGRIWQGIRDIQHDIVEEFVEEFDE